MTKTSTISFKEFQRFLNQLGFVGKRTDAACAFRHPTEGLLVFRVYSETEPVDERDLHSARRFLDMRGVLEAKDFDMFVQGAKTPA